MGDAINRHLKSRGNMRKAVLSAGALILLASSAIGAGAQSQNSLFTICGSIADDKARLACYDEARRQNAAAQSATVPARTPPPSSPTPGPSKASAPPPAANFGRRAAAAPAPRPDPRQMTAGVTGYSFDKENKFTVVLDNGQVWRQFDADFGTAKFRDHGANTVVITRGFWDSYNMRLNKMNAVFRVARIK
jgi:hypothetical protein